MSTDLMELVPRLGQPDVLVVGDLMLDRYVWGDAERVSQEAPVILLRADKREERLGGASSVATLLRALGARVALAGIVGNDGDGARVRHLLAALEIEHDGVFTDGARPTTVKERYVGRAQHRHPQQILRVDYEVRDSLEAGVEAKLKTWLTIAIKKTDLVLVSDYDKGVCTDRIVPFIIATAHAQGKRVVVDPIRCKGALKPHPYGKYRGCSAMTPNRLEAGLATGRGIRNLADALDAGADLLRELDLEAAIITLDKDGMALVHRDGRKLHFPTRPRHVYDITGAGDMVLSALGMALATGVDYDPAIRLANVAGGLEVERIGVAPVSRDEILRDLAENDHHRNALVMPSRKVLPRDQVARVMERVRRGGQRIVFTNGCFDVLHAGHVQYLHEARAQGDVLAVGINTDEGVRRLKGSGRPLNPEAARVDVLAALACVDFVVPFDEPTPWELIQCVRPHVLVKGADYRKDQVVGAEFVEANGGRVHLAALRQGFSTTGILQRAEGADLKQVA